MRKTTSNVPAASAANRQLLTADRRCAVASSHGVDSKVIGACPHTAAQLRPQFLRYAIGIEAVANNLRADEDDELGPGCLLVLMREGIAQSLDFIQQWNSAAISVLLLADQSGQQNGLPAGHRDR